MKTPTRIVGVAEERFEVGVDIENYTVVGLCRM